MQKFLLFLAFVFAFSLVFSFVSAQGEQPPPQTQCPPPPSCGISSFPCNQTIEYRCANNQCGKDGGAIQQRTRYYMCTTTCTPGSDPNGCPSCICSTSQTGPHFTEPITSNTGKYQICPASGNNWSTSPPSLVCAGQCYPAPTVKQLNDTSLSPKNVFDNGNNSIPKLPINFGWENNVETELASPGSQNPDGTYCTVGSYKYEVPNSLLPTSGELPSTQHNIIIDEDECKLSPNTSYTFKVQACQNNTCGATGTLNFTTSSAPQLLLPYDSDWEEAMSGEVGNPPVQLKWCENPDAQSYLLRVSIKRSDTDIICHPWYGGSPPNCNYRLLTRVVRPPPYPSEEILLPEFTDLEGLFTKDTYYIWEIASCLFRDGSNCTSYSQAWNFRTSRNFAVEPVTAESPLNDPEGTNQVGLPLVLKWSHARGIFLYQYEIKKRSTGEVVVLNTTPSTQSAPIQHPTLSLDTFYLWRVRGCTKTTESECQGIWGEWSEPLIFKTTGAPPQTLGSGTTDEQGHIILPALLSWQKVSGAGSYQYQISPNSSFSDGGVSGVVDGSVSQVSVDFPNLRTDRDYWWRVKTCADRAGDICGLWSDPRQFHTFILRNPTAPTVPQNGGEFWTYQRALSWTRVQGAKAYRYTVFYSRAGNPPQDELDPSCRPLVGTYVVPDTTVQSAFAEPQLKCLGNYEWKVISCLDVGCTEQSTTPVSTWTFRYVQPPPPSLPGLLVCGRTSDHPDTPYNERNRCELKHLFLILHNLIDFALWKLSPTIVLLMTILTGVVMFTSFGGIEVLTKIKRIWRGVGVGVLILLFSWILLNLILGILGFNINIFGRWYELPI